MSNMWKLNQNINSVPIVFNKELNTISYRNDESLNILNLTNQTHETYKLVKLTFQPILSNLFDKFNLYTHFIIVRQFINDNFIELSYKDLLHLGNEYSYFYDKSIYYTKELENLYLYTDSLNTIELTLDFSVTNIKDVQDLYMFTVVSELENIYIQKNIDKPKQIINLDFLKNYNISEETIVTFRYEYLLDIENMVDTVLFNNIVKLQNLDVKVFSKNTNSLDTIDIFKLDNKEYKEIFTVAQLDKRFSNALNNVALITPNYYLLI